MVAVVAGTVFSAISGSTIATTAMLGSLMLPVMLARGYHPTMATGPMMAIGAVDMLIPPSALTVLLGSLSGISISKLLIGGVVPGLMLASPSSSTSSCACKHEAGARADDDARAHTTAGSSFRPFVQYVLPLVSIFVIVVGAMSAGWATPTESAAIGALRDDRARARSTARSRWKILLAGAARHGRRSPAMILFIIVGATTFSQILSFSGASNGLVAGDHRLGPAAAGR